MADPVTQLTGASWNGQLEEVKRLLLFMSVDLVNSPNSRGQTALYCGCRQGHTEIVYTLLKIPGLNLNLQVHPHGSTPLHAASFSEHSEIVAMLLWNDANTQILNSVGLRPIQESKGDIMDVYEDFLSGSLLKSWPRLREFGFCNRNFLNSWVQSIGIQEKHATRLKQVLIGRQFEDITETFLNDLGIPGGPALKIMRARTALFGAKENRDFDHFSGLVRTVSVSLNNHEQNISQVFNGALAEYNMSTAALESLEKTYTHEVTQVNTVMQASLHVISEQLQYFSNTQTALVELQKRIAVCQESAKKLGNEPTRY